MANEWIEQQHERLAESEKRVGELKRRLVVEELETPAAELPPAPTVESLRKRRWWLVVALTFINGTSLFGTIHQVATWPSSASLFFSAELVTVRYDTQGNADYEAKVPLKEFPYEVQLGQQHRYDLLSSTCVNLLLLIAILHSYWQQARLERKLASQEPCP
jgi:hypothetical protein